MGDYTLHNPFFCVALVVFILRVKVNLIQYEFEYRLKYSERIHFMNKKYLLKHPYKELMIKYHHFTRKLRFKII